MTIIHFPVQAYDQAHLGLLTRGPRAEAVRKLLKSGLTTTDAAILIHTMFTEQDPNRAGFRSHKELAAKAESREAAFRDYITMTGGKIHAGGGQNTTQKSQTERLGVACAVLAMNEILGTTEADWERIEESNKKKTLDYQLTASDGKSIVAVEAKGTIAEAPEVKSSGSASVMKGDIEAKKKASRAVPGPRAHEEFGVITAIGKQAATTPRIYLLDPPAMGADRDPRRVRLLARMKYYLHHLALTSQFRMLIAVRNRINALVAISRTEELDGVQLTNADGEPFSLPEAFGDRPIVEVGGVVGRVLFRDRRAWKRESSRDGSMLFVGFARNIFPLLVGQKFDDLLA